MPSQSETNDNHLFNSSVTPQKTSFAQRYNLRPNEDRISWEFYLQQRKQTWDSEELLLSEDKNNFKKLPIRYQNLVEDLVAFFAPGDGIVSQQVLALAGEAKTFAQQAFLFEQLAIEVIHARAYSDVITTFFDSSSQERIFSSVDNLDCVKEKAVFISKYMEDLTLPVGLRYLAAAISEGIFFVSLFAVIFHLRSKKVLHRFCFLNEQVAKDEKLHRDFNIMQARRGYMRGEFNVEAIKAILTEGIKIEENHIKYILREPVDSVELDEMSGLTLENMNRFIATLADQIVIGLGLSPMFTVDDKSKAHDGLLVEFSPGWMSDISLTRKTNFYEQTSGSYTRISQPDHVENISAAFEDPSSLGI